MKNDIRPHVTCSIAVSLDGCIDDLSEDRLLISSEEHLKYIDELRAANDAILVGAATVRRDNPLLFIRSDDLRAARISRGMSPSPAKVTIVSDGDIPSDAHFFDHEEARKLLYCPETRRAYFEKKFSSVASVVPYGSNRLEASELLKDLFGKGIERLLIEGGEQIHTLVMQAGMVDELQLAVGPFFVGEEDAPRFVSPARFPFNKDNRLHLDAIERKGDTAILKYSAPVR